MANTIQIRRGPKATIPALAVGEVAFTTDTHEVFVGSSSGNVLVGPTGHPDIAAAASVNNSGATFIQDVTLDSDGHVTALGSVAINAATVGAVAVNSAITGASKCKITYDAKGLVTSGTDLTAADIPVLDMTKITTGNLLTTRLSEPTSVYSGVTLTSWPLFDVVRGDRTAFLPASQIIIEQSTDAGATWTDAGISDANKAKLFAGQRPSISIPLKNGVKSTDCMLRVTVTGMRYNVPGGTAETDKYAYWNTTNVTSTERYFAMDGGWVWLSSNSDRIYFKAELATGADPNTWVLQREGYMSGWSGGNFFTVSNKSFGGGTTQTSNGWNWRFTFRTCTPTYTFDDAELATTYTTQAQVINHIKTVGKSCYSYSNNLMYNDHLYNWDENKNAIFPANVTSLGDIYAGNNGSGKAMASKFYVGGFTDLINDSPWYGMGDSDVTDSGQGGSLIQVAGYYGLLLKSGSNELKITNETTNRLTLNGNVIWHDGNANAKVDARITKAAIENVLTGTVSSHSHAATGPVSIDGVSNNGGNIDIVGGTGITVTPDDTNNTITITATGGQTPAAHAAEHLGAGTDPITLAASKVVATDSSGHLTTVNNDLHVHGNKATLDAYTQTEANLADAVSKKHAQSHALTSADHTASGLTAGQVLRATGTTAFGFGAIQATDLPAAIDAVKIANGNVSNTEFQYLDGVTSSIQTQLDGKAAGNHNHDGVYSPVGHTHTGMVGKYATTIGDGTAYNFSITHGLGTQDVVVSVLDIASGYTVVLVDWSAATTNTVTITCATAPPATGYRVTVIG